MTLPAARVDELKKRYEENPRRFFAPLANEYRKAGDLDAAIDLCRMHLEEQPGHLSGHIVYGQALFESARADEAKTIFEAALTLDPENLIALRHLGDIARAGSDATAAKHWYGRVLEADPRNDEVIALIDALGQAAPPPSVVIAEQHAPPPPPNYADQAGAVLFVDPNAPTPVVPVVAVPLAPAAPEPRLSLGLMDLDLNLAGSTAPTVDLLGSVPPTADAVPMVADVPPVEADEPAPSFNQAFSLAESGPAAPDIEGAALPGAPDLSLVAAVAADTPVELHDTSFDAPPVADDVMFATAHEEPSFGDSLDVTAAVDVEDIAAAGTGPFGSLQLDATGDTVPIGESVTDPKPVLAAAAPATPADFDALFGNAPIADVVIGGDESTAPTETAGFVADSFVGREATDQVLAGVPELATPPSPFVTETMAELYLQQGFRDEALSVYRQLLAQNPDDKGLADRVMRLEHGTRSSLAIDSVSVEIEAEVKAEELRRSGSIPTVPAAPAVEREPEPAMFAPTPAPTSAAVGPTAREVFSRIASRRAVPGGGSAAAGGAASATNGQAAIAPVAAAVAGERALSSGGALDRLFGMTGVSAADEEAAVTMAAAFGAAFGAATDAATETPIQGEPTRKGTDELSLDSVFGSDATSAPPSMVQRQSTRLRFDQFFPGTEGESAAAPPPSASPVAGDDVAQFSDWLKGLKGS